MGFKSITPALHHSTTPISPFIWQLISFALFFGLWELAGRWPISFSFPPFSKTLLALLSMIADGSLAKAYLSTLQPLVIGIALAGVIGIGFGIAHGTLPLHRMVQLADFHRSAGGADGGDHPADHLHVRHRHPFQGIGRRCLGGAGDRDEFLQGHPQHQPFADPDVPRLSWDKTAGSFEDRSAPCGALIFAGLRLGVAMGFIGIVIAELLITPTGIGDLITYNSSVADYPQMFAAIVSIIIFAALTIHALERLERKLFPPEMRGLEHAG